MAHNRLITILALLLTLLASQAGHTQQTNELSVTNPNPATAESVTDSTASVVATPTIQPTKAHLLVSDDLIEIKVYQQPDLETRARIAPDGSVTMPLLGAITVGGKSVEEARAMIHGLLAKDYLVKPQVSVTVVEYAKRLFTILGEVVRPGTYEIPTGEPFSLLQAIALAGGYTRIGSPGKVTVQRMENGQRKVYNLNAGSMAKDEKSKPFEVFPGDNITVGERFF
jgi:protein involved in polysaccharide export with SLBB domain